MPDENLKKAIHKRPKWCKAIVLIKGRQFWFGLDEYNLPVLAGVGIFTDVLYFIWGLWAFVTGKYGPASKELCTLSVVWCDDGFTPEHFARYAF